MRRDQLEHLIRAAGAILDESELIVIGSQAILASFDAAHLPAETTRSVEADIVPIDDVDEAKSTLIDGTIGELSPFHSSFGVYAHGVGERTARLPTGWRDRLRALRNENTAGVTGWCLDPHDLAVAKLIAGRPHDLEFCRALLRAELLDADLLSRRLDDVALADEERDATRERLNALARGVANRPS
ncbi:hypothetical protein BH23ACT10_BH23ACT10_33350 [soil metagenome]